MFRRIIGAVVVGAFMVAACSGAEPLEGIDLPPASVPESIEPDSWAVTFTREFLPGFWLEGTHGYELALACDVILDQPMRTGPHVFDVAESVPTFPEPIYLRIVGPSHLLMGPQTLNTLNPAQATTAALTILGVSEEDAKTAVESCIGAIFYDGGEPEPMFPSSPFRP
jgi:hypothetical protein